MKLKRYLSFALAAIMILSMSLIPVSAQSEIQYTSADLPEMLSYNDAVSAGHVNRLTAEEELNTLVFANSDNTKTMYYFSENIKYVDESGDICYKTNDLTYSSGAYINAENDINVSLPLTLSSGVTLAYEDILISMTPNVTGSSSVSDSISASAVFNSASNNQSDSVSYQSVFGVGTAVRYTPLYSGIKEDIILSSYTGVYSFNFLIETNGLLILPESTISDDDSMISGNASELSEPTRWYFAYEDDTDTPVALISDIYIYDSVGAETKGSVSITPYIDDNYILTVTADRAFLESSSTVYPVTIDPTITINYNNSTIHDSSISSYLVTSNFGSDSYLNVGGSYNYYSALKFQGLTNNSVFSSLSAGQIYSSTLNMYCYSKSGTNMSVTVSQYSPNSITSGYWTEGTITYSKCGVKVDEVDEVNAVTKTITSAVPYSFDITDIVKKWKSNSNLIEQGLLFSPSDSSSSAMAVFASSEYSTASLRPYLTINYVCNGIYKIKNGSNYIGFENNYAGTESAVKNMTIDSSDTNDFSKEYRITYISSVDAYTIRPLASKNGYDLYLYSDGSKLILKNSVCYFKFTLNSNGTYKISASNATSKYATAGDTQISMSSTSSSSQNWTLVWSEKNESYAYYESLGFGLPLNSCEVSSRYGVRDMGIENNPRYQNHFALDLNKTSDYAKSICKGKVVVVNQNIKISTKDDGTIEYSGMGNYVIIKVDPDQHGYAYNDINKSIYVLYGHFGENTGNLKELSNCIFVNPGDDVEIGDTLGMVGDSGGAKGDHIHFSVFIYNTNDLNSSIWSSFNELNYSNTIDPRIFIKS